MRDIAVVTGASSGIGAAIYHKLKQKYEVKGISRRGPDITANITNPEQVEAAFNSILRNSGVPKILINCAGFVEPKTIMEMTPQEWDYTLKVNLTGVFLCTRELLRHNKSGGKIINIASTSGQRASPGWAAYAAAKAAVINFSLSMSEELRPYGIKVYCVSPGRCATGLRRKLVPDEDQSRIMQPEEVADFVYYLAEHDNILDNQPLTVKRGLL